MDLLSVIVAILLMLVFSLVIVIALYVYEK